MGPVTQEYDARVASGVLTRDPAQATVLAEFDRIAESLRAAKPGGLKALFGKKPEAVRGLYLWGGVGRGKSMLMDLFHDVLVGDDTRRVHFHEFMQEVQSGLHEARQTGVDDALLPVADKIRDGLRLLCLDEMQITDITDAMIVGRLFDLLLEDGVVVVTTSNRVPDDLYKDGLNRALFLPFIDLIKDRLVVHELASPKDYRQDRLQGEQVYFHPSGAEARAAIRAIWEDLSGAKSAPLKLAVKGRVVELPDYSNGVARTSFYDLCGQPLGPADYLALAENIRVLILEDIPRLGSENYNQAKRFVTLVDALYEAHVRLIASAADVPERLYIEGAGSFEFERTASRLPRNAGRGLGQQALTDDHRSIANAAHTHIGQRDQNDRTDGQRHQSAVECLTDGNRDDRGPDRRNSRNDGRGQSGDMPHRLKRHGVDVADAKPGQKENRGEPEERGQQQAKPRENADELQAKEHHAAQSVHQQRARNDLGHPKGAARSAHSRCLNLPPGSPWRQTRSETRLRDPKPRQTPVDCSSKWRRASTEPVFAPASPTRPGGCQTLGESRRRAVPIGTDAGALAQAFRTIAAAAMSSIRSRKRRRLKRWHAIQTSWQFPNPVWAQ